jgi:hypothetical protein
MTPRQFYFLVCRHEERLRAQWQHTAAMLSLYANCHRDTEKRPTPFTPDEFMPGAAERRQVKLPQAEPGQLGPEIFAAFEDTFAEAD